MASGKAMRLCIQTLFFGLVVDIDVITSLQNKKEEIQGELIQELNENKKIDTAIVSFFVRFCKLILQAI